MCPTLRICAHLIGYVQGEKGVFETLTQGKGGVYLGGTSRSDPADHRARTRNDGLSRPGRIKLLATAAVRRRCGETEACSQ